MKTFLDLLKRLRRIVVEVLGLFRLNIEFDPPSPDDRRRAE